MTDVASYIDRYVDGLVDAGHIRSELVERAFRSVPRHRCIAGYYADGDRYVEVPQGDDSLVPDDVVAHVYSDVELISELGEGGRPVISAIRPAHLAAMLEALDLAGGERVLEIGAGTGYCAALVAEITGVEVVTVDLPDIADAARASLVWLDEKRVTVIVGDGYQGHAEGGPYDRVIVTVGAVGVAEPWLDQLDLDRFVVAPVLTAGRYPILKVERGRPFTAAGQGIYWADIAGGRGALAHRNERTNVSGAAGGPRVLTDPGFLHLTAPRTLRRFVQPLDPDAYKELTGFVIGLGSPGP